MNKISRFFGWLFATDAYIATLSEDEIAVRVLGKEGAAKYLETKRASEAQLEQLERLLADYRAQPVTFIAYDITYKETSQ